ncbi:MAG: hypothetical protein ACSLE6_18715 [Mycobacterium sp.]
MDLVIRSAEDADWPAMTRLAARTYSADLTAVICVGDQVLGGGGRSALEIANGKARCTPTDADADADVRLSGCGATTPS